MPFFTKNDNIYPTGDYREVVMGDNVGIREIGGPYIVNPSNFSTYWHYGSVQEAVDTIADALANGGDITTIQDPVEELSPELVLDAIDLNSLILDGTDTVAVLDQSEALAETLVYESDFSVNENGWTSARLTLNFGIDVLGKEDTLKGTLNSGLNSHLYRHITLLTIGKSYHFTGSVYVPTGQIATDGFVLQSGTVDIIEYKTSSGSWVDIDLNFVASSEELRIRTTSGNSETYAGDGDFMYIHNFRAEEIQGNHLTQLTIANRPVVDSATVPTQIDFLLANAEYLENTLDVSTFAAMSQGSIVFINDGSSVIQFGIGNTSNYDMIFGADTLVRFYQSNGQSTLRGTIPTSIGDVIELKTDGTAWRFFVNGIEDTVDVQSGTNLGEFFNQMGTLTGMTIARTNRSVDAYVDTTFKHLMIRSTPLTDAKSRANSNYIRYKHNLYP